MEATKLKRIRRHRRKRGIRKGVFGVPTRPRLSVFRSARHIYVQVVDDLKGHTICSASTNEKAGRAANGGNCDAASEVGKNIAARAKEAGVEAVIFDRNGFRYHGRIKALAEGAREGGLKF